MARLPCRRLRFSIIFQQLSEKSAMNSITLIPGNQTGHFPKGTLLLDALMDMGVNIKTPCGGKGICGKCRIRVTGELSGKTEAEKKIPTNKTNDRLACQAHLSGDTKVFIDENHFISRKTYPKVNPDDHFAVAVDVGTTSVNISLVSLSQGVAFDLDTFLNPQRRFGFDVISRIAAASDPINRQTMTRQIRQTIFNAIASALNAMNIPCPAIEQIIFSGNTTMLYLLFGLDVSGLGRFPFHAPCLDFDNFTLKDINADLFPHARISAIPAVSAFLGGDLVGGLTLCYEMGFTENIFFIDLGTNGELFLINGSGDIYAASCAMGPALEGMNISWGMTADDGAVTHVRIDSGKLAYNMIGEGPPVGLAGTALIDIISCFLSEGLINRNGAFVDGLENRQLPHPAQYSDGLSPKQIRLWGDIAISQKDVRNLQLAKGASLSASRFILQAADCSQDEVKHVLIAGAFGSHLDLDNFKCLGFIPEFPEADYHYLGNTSLKAAGNACFNDNFLKNAARFRDRVTEVELAKNPEFNNAFIKALDF